MRIADRERNRRACAHVLRKLRVIRRREWQTIAQAPAARGHAERAFGRDVNAVGRELVELLREVPIGKPREPDLGIRRTWKRPELIRLDDQDFVTGGTQRSRRRAQCLNDTIGLRTPGVGNDRYLHAACSNDTGTSAPLCVITSLLSVQRSRLSWPLKSSVSVVQLSTQSPSLQYRTPSICEISARWIWPQIAPSSPRRCASCASARSKFAMYFTAFFTLCLRYAASDQYGAPNARRSRFK